MGKVSPKEKGCKRTKQRRQLQRSSSKYLKPGALAQLRCNKSSTAKSCTDIGKKHSKKTENSVVSEDNIYDRSPLLLSPVNLVKQNNLLGTPKTPRIENCQSDSRLESLPMDLLVCLITLSFSVVLCCRLGGIIFNVIALLCYVQVMHFCLHFPLNLKACYVFFLVSVSNKPYEVIVTSYMILVQPL